MPRKITRIFFRTSGFVLLALLLLVTVLFFLIRSYAFQTWLARKASAYFSGELQTEITIDRVKLNFFRDAEIVGLLVKDQQHDTLFCGHAEVELEYLNYADKKVAIRNAKLSDAIIKLKRKVGEKSFNYQFLVDYFSSDKKPDTTGVDWVVKPGVIELSDVAFTYFDEKNKDSSQHLIDFYDLRLDHLSTRVRDLEFKDDTILAKIDRLEAREKAGFTIRSLRGEFLISPARLQANHLDLFTNLSHVRGDITFTHRDWDDYNDFVNKVNIDAVLDSTQVHSNDIAFFAEELLGMNRKVYLSGTVKGTVADLNLSHFKLRYGKNTNFAGDLSVSGLPDIEHCFLHFDAQQLSTSFEDLASIPDYPFGKKGNLKIPIEISRLGVIRYRGKLDGFVTDFNTHGTFNTGLGMVKTSLSVKSGSAAADFIYKGHISTQAFNLGHIFGMESLKNLTMNMDVDGKGLDLKSLDAELDGDIASLQFNDYDYHNIHINGSIRDKLFNGLLRSKDPNADFDFNGTVNFMDKVPKMDFIAGINKLSLRTLGFTGRSDSGSISSQIFISIRGSSIDDLTGQVNLDNTMYRTASKSYSLSHLNILLRQDEPNKMISLRSAYANFAMNGNFQLSALPDELKTLAYYYYPTFFKKPFQKNSTHQFAFKLNVLKFGTIRELLLPELDIASNTSAEGEFNAAENKLNLQLSAPYISYGDAKAHELLLLVNQNGQEVIGELSMRDLGVGDSSKLQNFNIHARSFDKDTRYALDWDNLQKPATRGELSGSVTFGQQEFQIRNQTLSLTVQDSTWSSPKPFAVDLNKDGTLRIADLVLEHQNDKFSAQGVLGEQISDSLSINADNIRLQQLNPLLKMYDLTLKGTLNGDVVIKTINKNKVFDGNLLIQNLVLNDNELGELQVNAEYQAGEKQVHTSGFSSLGLKDESGKQVKNIAFSGTYYLDRKEESIDIDFTAQPANLKLLNPYLKDIITIGKAYVNGGGKVHGTPKEIKIDGKFTLFNGELKVDYTNVWYNVSGEIEVMPDQIRFTDLLMREKGTRSVAQGTVNGNIFHSNFGRMQLDYDINFRNMLVMNTTEKDNGLFYGKMYGSGRMGIYGFINRLHMEITDTTKGNSSFVLPLDGPAEIGENDYIHFVKKDTVKVKKKQTFTGFDLDMRIHATPAAQAQIILDKQHGDMMSARGQGDLNLTMNTMGKFEMFGDYVITEGSYLFTLENVVNKKFEIDPGSSISWSGNPYNADVDVVTSYKQRASIAPLLNDTSGKYKSRVPVECKLLISGKLFTPQIKFDVEFPGVDANTTARINSVLSDEAELNRQVFSFLLFRGFVTPQIFNAHGGGVNAASAAASTGSEMLSNRVSEFLSSYVGNVTGLKDLQVGLNYRPSTQNSGEAVDLALSKQFLNNKITVDGNFGVNNTSMPGNSSGLVGDVSVEYKLSEDGRYRLKGFNRSNSVMQLTTTGGPYTQGVGLFYKEEFETFQQLMNRYLKKKKPVVATQ